MDAGVIRTDRDNGLPALYTLLIERMGRPALFLCDPEGTHRHLELRGRASVRLHHCGRHRQTGMHTIHA